MLHTTDVSNSAHSRLSDLVSWLSKLDGPLKYCERMMSIQTLKAMIDETMADKDLFDKALIDGGDAKMRAEFDKVKSI